ncbi:hypothetical protein [Chromobacterium violaceum]|uniref:Putative 4-hydroxy-4-methyl-2-oxoglutarate aldolase n=1 Tax=Chromobacterium violaceum TaxID=536 RepID=A0AAX2MA42_CHRVL|nr:Putative regulator of ribonuclease activity [Chromobacterium violaceum]
MSLATTDLCDAFDAEIQVLDPVFQSFGGHARFHGPIATLKLFEDNSQVRQMLGEPGNGRVLVVDGAVRAAARCWGTSWASWR